MESNSQPLEKILFTLGELRGNSCEVIRLDLVIVGLDHGFLAGKVVVSGAKGDVGGFGYFSHRDGVDSALAEQAQSRVENEGPCCLTCGAGLLRVEHVQIMGLRKLTCQGKSEHVQ